MYIEQGMFFNYPAMQVGGTIAGLCYLHSRTPPVIHGDVHDVSVGMNC